MKNFLKDFPEICLSVLSMFKIPKRNSLYGWKNLRKKFSSVAEHQKGIIINLSLVKNKMGWLTLNSLTSVCTFWKLSSVHFPHGTDRDISSKNQELTSIFD